MTETQDIDFCTIICWKAWVDYYIYLSTPSIGSLMKAVGSHGSSSLLFLMKVMVWHFVRISHKVMTTLIIMLASKCWCEDFSAVPYIWQFCSHCLCLITISPYNCVKGSGRLPIMEGMMKESFTMVFAVGHSRAGAIQNNHQQLLPRCSWNHCMCDSSYVYPLVKIVFNTSM